MRIWILCLPACNAQFTGFSVTIAEMEMASGFRRSVRVALVFVCAIAFAQNPTPKVPKTDAEIKQAIIAESIASYRATRETARARTTPTARVTDAALGVRRVGLEVHRRFATRKM